ncbi:MAG: Peptidase like family [Chloroflexota bacterium]|jgi:uncharacterized protein YvpB|nr:Peptidase like family [Chloroflexota bacterium]
MFRIVSSSAARAAACLAVLLALATACARSPQPAPAVEAPAPAVAISPAELPQIDTPGAASLSAPDVPRPQDDGAPGWAETIRSAEIWADARATVKSATLPRMSWVEVLGGVPGGSILVRYPGDGHATPPGEGWVAPGSIERIPPPPTEVLPRAYPATTESSVQRIQAPYHSQLDGTPWAEANCGPTTLSMALGAYGIDVASAELRTQTLDAQGMWGDEAGTLLDALAQVAQSYGVRPIGLYGSQGFRRWSVADVRQQLEAGRPVIVQVLFRALPGREASLYYGDHYVVLTGLVGDSFLYNDAVDSDGVGYDRLMSADTLQQAMRASDKRYAYTAFALAR